MKTNYDVIIAGCGAAGLYGAINLPSELSVLVLAKKELTLCNSALAQGGIAGVYKSPEDSPELHKHDTFVAGGFENDPVTTDILVNEAADAIDSIIKMGVEFDKKEDGDYHRTLEGGHGMRRIFHHKDATGFEIETKLLAYAQTLPNVTILENALVCETVKTETGFSLLVLKDDDYVTFNSRKLIFATGGIGRVYEFTTNSAIATGDGIAMAYKLGAPIKHLSYIQFHPTAFNNRSTRECFLISEAVRGEGAYLKNCYKERFMDRYDKRLELAPRDVVSHSIIFESKRTGSDEFWLDISHKDPEFIKERFPMIYENLLKYGYDLTKEPVPIYPCQHYLMGGIDVDEWARTGVEGLYACGECSHTGVHGNNRLASNSLLEALVFSKRAAKDIAEKLSKEEKKELVSYEFKVDKNAPPIPKGIRTDIRRVMQKAYFVMPEVSELKDGLKLCEVIMDFLNRYSFRLDRDYIEARNLATVAYIVLSEACDIAFGNVELDIDYEAGF